MSLLGVCPPIFDSQKETATQPPKGSEKPPQPPKSVLLHLIRTREGIALKILGCQAAEESQRALLWVITLRSQGLCVRTAASAAKAWSQL